MDWGFGVGGCLTGERVVVAEDLEVLAVSRGAAIGGHDTVKGPVPAAEPREPDPHHHGFLLLVPRRRPSFLRVRGVVWEEWFWVGD